MCSVSILSVHCCILNSIEKRQVFWSVSASLLQRFYLLKKTDFFAYDPTLCYWSGWIVLWSPWTLSITFQTVLVLTDPHRRLHHSLSVLWWIHALKNWNVDQRWFNVYDVGSTLSQRLVNVSCLVGCVWRQSTVSNSKRGTNRNDLVFWLCSFLEMHWSKIN